MQHWVDTYPHDIHASVLLLDGKIENWKVSQRPKGTMDFTNFWKMDRINDYTSETKKWTVENSDGHNQVFVELAPEWFKQWELADDYRLASPFEVNDFMPQELTHEKSE